MPTTTDDIKGNRVVWMFRVDQMQSSEASQAPTARWFAGTSGDLLRSYLHWKYSQPATSCVISAVRRIDTGTGEG